MASDWTGESNLVILCGSDKDFPFGNSTLPDKQQLGVYTLDDPPGHMLLL